jgi:hypothetical protein
VRLHLLSEDLFERYARRLADSSEEGNLRRALGLIYVHLVEEITADSAAGPVTDVGLRRGRLGRPRWFVARAPQADRSSPSSVWLAEPPSR